MSHNGGINWSGDKPDDTTQANVNVGVIVTYDDNSSDSVQMAVESGLKGIEVAQRFVDKWNTSATSSTTVAEVFTDGLLPGGNSMIFDRTGREINKIEIQTGGGNPVELGDFFTGALGALGYGEELQIADGLFVRRVRPALLVLKGLSAFTSSR